jgi:hypothetical protein
MANGALNGAPFFAQETDGKRAFSGVAPAV